MPNDYYIRINAMRKYSIAFIAEAITLPVAAYVLILSIAHQKLYTSFATGLLILVQMLCIVKAKKEIKNKSENICPYVIERSGISANSIVESLSAVPITQDAFVSFCDYNKLSFRVLIIISDEYDKGQTDLKKKSANKIINKKFGTDRRQSAYKLNSIRINVQMFYGCSQNLDCLLQQNATQLLRRIEPIVNVFVDLKNELIIFPAVCEELYLKEVKAYKAATEFVLEKMS